MGLKIESEAWLENVIEEHVRAFKRQGGAPYGIILPIIEWPSGRRLTEATVDGETIHVLERGDCESDSVYVVDKEHFEGAKRMPKVTEGGIIIQ